MRERLIELINGFKELDFCIPPDWWIEHFADYLLANGVVIIDPQKYPPVNNQRIIKTVLGVSLDEMAELIDAKQEGRIIVLPCKVGDNLFALSASGTKVYVFTVARLDITESGILIWGKAHYTKELVAICSNYDIGDSVFLTREEAEKALKEDRV